MTNEKKTAVFFHHPCLDGDMAMYVAHKVLGEDGVSYHGLNHGKNMGVEVRAAADDSEVIYFIDIAPDRATLLALLEAGKEVWVLDHHLTAIRQLKDFTHPNYHPLFDHSGTLSGAGLAWKYLVEQPKKNLGEDHQRIFEVVQHVQLIDLNQTTQPNFYELACYYDVYPMDTPPHIIISFDKIITIPVEDKISQGRKVLIHLRQAQDEAFQATEIREIKVGNFAGVRIALVPGNLQELGRELFPRMAETYQGDPIIGAWFLDKESETIRISLRRNHCNPAASDIIDLAALAEDLGKHGVSGGGHLDSAAVQLDKKQFETLLARVHLAKRSKGQQSSSPEGSNTQR